MEQGNWRGEGGEGYLFEPFPNGGGLGLFACVPPALGEEVACSTFFADYDDAGGGEVEDCDAGGEDYGVAGDGG